MEQIILLIIVKIMFLVYASTSEVYGKNNNVPWLKTGISLGSHIY